MNLRKITLICGIIVISLGLFLDHFIEPYLSNFQREILIPISMIITVIFYYGSMTLMKSKAKQDLTDKSREEFAKVGSAENKVDLKPIDLSGNVFIHNEETMNEDLKNMGIDINKNSKD